jgi:dTDP-4-dehydrorhamnose reductase
MRIMILGGDGMLGHQLYKCLKERHHVCITLRREFKAYDSLELYRSEDTFDRVDARDLNRVKEAVGQFHPDVVVNAVGIVKQQPAAKEVIPSLEINALLPHRLALVCKAAGSRLIHMSTDCVFSGNRGNYLETDPSDAKDLYGKSKFLGEVHESHCLTLRTSIIGRELSRRKSLVEWFLAQKGTIKGFQHAIYSGFTTVEMSRIIEKVVTEFPESSGLYQVSSDPISKYELLLLMKDAFRHPVDVVPDDEFFCDRSLNSERFQRDFDYTPPPWKEMVEELAGNVYGRVS